MSNSIYTAISRQSALRNEINSISNNIANANTIGYRTDRPFYSEYVHSLGPLDDNLSQTRLAGRTLDGKNGTLIKTGATFDVALEGEGFFVVETQRGQRLTRAGSFTLSTEGTLTTLTGYTVTNESGSPISIPLDANEIVIAADGSIAADGAPVGQISVVTANAIAISREGDNLIRADAPIQLLENTKVRQGFLEQSNVNTITELARLIEVQRAYELNQQIISDEHSRILRTINSFDQ